MDKACLVARMACMGQCPLRIMLDMILRYLCLFGVFFPYTSSGAWPYVRPQLSIRVLPLCSRSGYSFPHLYLRGMCS